MINDNDIQLSKMSFTDKDFASLYPDLLDLARQLTNEWDPSQSTNESDPGVVLLKEGAFIADHNNYNIDKNILEAFLPSATQDRSVRNITEMNGYTPRYYVSATGDLTLTYNPEQPTETGFVIPAFTIVATNKDENIAYTQISNLNINRSGIPSSCRFMEGTLNTLEVNGSDQILLENIDENNRLYLPNIYIAQNGIFIKNYGESDNSLWTRNNYLSTQPLGSKIYKFDFDSTVNLPYIEFPSDIANIIDNGLSVRYISTTGSSGNIKAGEIVKIQTPKEYTTYEGTQINVSDDFEVLNQSAINNGKNPETINEMYRSFRKVVGTFDTLVTTKDYTNAIFNLEDDYNKPLISNDVVTDIKNDYNYAANVVTFDQYGEYFENVSLNSMIYHFVGSESEASKDGDIWYDSGTYKVLKNGQPVTLTSLSYQDFVAASESMTPYDLCIHALTAFSMSDYLANIPGNAINKSFEPADIPTINIVKNSLGELKCINHTFKDVDSDSIYCFKNYVPLNVTITPYTKIGDKDKKEIFQNIYKALSENFNARMVDFGEELNYDEVVDVLISADDRIKTIRLEDFEYRPVAVKLETGLQGGDIISEYDVYSPTNTEILVDLVAKNVLAGRLCLFNIDEDFDYRYGQQDSQVIDDVVEIKTESKIPFSPGSGSTPPAGEEVIISEVPSGEDSSAGEWRMMITYANSLNPGATLSLTANTEKTIPSGGTVSIQPVYWVSNSNYTLAGPEELYFSNSETTDYVTLTYTGSSTLSSTAVFLDSGTLTIKHHTIKSAGGTGTNLNYVVQDNEFIQIAYPNYYSTKVYPTYCYYRFYLSGNNNQSQEGLSNIYVAANNDYKLKAGEHLVVLYSKDGVQQTDQYGPGTIIKTSFDMYYTDFARGTTTKKTYDAGNGFGSIEAQFLALSAGQQIEIRELLETVLNNISTPCFWITNNPGDILFKEGEQSVILGSGEYFIYSNSAYDSMVILGAGTKLTRSSSDTTQWALGDINTTPSSINNEGYLADIAWDVKDFSNGKELKIQEMNIVTLGSGDKIIISGASVQSGETIDNEWKEIVSQNDELLITYIIGGESNTLRYTGTFDYDIRSRLDISLNHLQTQTLSPNQSVEVVYNTGDSGSSIIISGDGSSEFSEYPTLQSSTNLELIGDNSIDLSDYSKAGTKVGLMVYSNKSPSVVISNSAPVELVENNGTYTENIVGSTGKFDFPFSYNFIYNRFSETYKQYIFPVFLLNNSFEEGKGKLHVRMIKDFDITQTIYSQLSRKVQFFDYHSGEVADEYILTDTNMYLFCPVLIPLDNSSSNTPQDELGGDTYQTISGNVSLVIYWDYSSQSSDEPGDAEAIVVYNPVVINDINPDLSMVSLSSVVNRMKELVNNSSNPEIKPYYIYKPTSDMAIQDEDISNPNIFWDKNNVANIITIPQIDLDNSNFEILKSMDLTLKKNQKVG